MTFIFYTTLVFIVFNRLKCHKIKMLCIMRDGSRYWNSLPWIIIVLKRHCIHCISYICVVLWSWTVVYFSDTSIPYFEFWKTKTNGTIVCSASDMPKVPIFVFFLGNTGKMPETQLLHFNISIDGAKSYPDINDFNSKSRVNRGRLFITITV